MNRAGQPLRATSDLHLSADTAETVFEALEVLRADARETGGATVLAGDIFHQAESVHMPTWNRLRRMLYHWPERIFVIVGNHDQYGPRQEDHCLVGLAAGPCTVIDRPTWTQYGRMVPYTSPADFSAAIECKGSAPPRGESMLDRFLWTHHGYRGAYQNAMRRDRTGVRASDVPADAIVITGHYHMPQTIGNIVYCGSPYETTFAEEGQRKGWLRWDDPFSDPLPRRVPFDLSAPRHYTIRWDPAKGPPPKPAGIRSQDKVRVITSATRKEAKGKAKQLVKAGLEGAPILAKPDTSMRARQAAASTPGEAIDTYLVANAEDCDPVALREFAEEYGLWVG